MFAKLSELCINRNTLHTLYNKKSNKCDVGLLWINMAKMFIFHKYIESYFMKYSKSGTININIFM